VKVKLVQGVTGMSEEVLNSIDGTPDKDADLELWGRLFQTIESIKRARARDLSQYKVTVMESAILFHVDTLGDKATTSQTAKQLSRKHHGVLGLIAHMKKRQLLREIVGGTVEEAHYLELTSKGRSILKKVNQKQPLHQVFSSLTKQERMQLLNILSKLSRACLDERNYQDNLYYL